ncbi:ATP-binding protein [Pseudoalteromonas sp. SSDWG2]|uniref:ATP-binding protein n=1 Tax=Pseudoalteromonas sp. SSDWG2 TaxID=3139391 RepID=UPI003BAD6D27
MGWFERFGWISILLLLSAVFLGTSFYSYKLVQKNHALEVQEELTQQLESLRAIVQTRLEYGQREVRVLSNTPPNQGIIRAIDNGGFDALDNTSLEQWRDRLATIYSSYLAEHKEIVQLRYILVNERFEEFVRVDNSPKSTNLTSQQKLQSKRGRDYIVDSMALTKDETYISDINLNREFGRLPEVPEPTYRISRLVFDEKGQPRAIVVINYDANQLLSSLMDDLQPAMGLYVIGGAGHFVSHPDTRWQYANEYNSTFTPALQQVVDTGQRFYSLQLYRDKLSSQDVFLQSQTVEVSNRAKPITLTLMSYVTKEHLEQAIAAQWRVWFSAFIVAYLVMLVVLIWYNHFVSKQLHMSRSIREFKAIIESVNTPLLGLDKSFKISSSNPAAQMLFQLDENDIKGRSFAKLLRLDNKAQSQIIQSAKQCEYFTLDIEYLDAHENLRNLQLNVVPFHHEQSTKASTALILYDYSEQWQLRNELQTINSSLERQVAQRTEQLEQARMDAEDANEAKSLFVANMSHELRTPMNGVFGMLNLIKKEPLSEQQLNYLNLAQTSAVNLTNLINSVLDISKIEAGKMELEAQSIDLEGLLGELIQSNSIRASEKGLVLLLDTSELKQRNFIGDATRVRQIFTNLVGNAIKFTDSGYVCVRVTNSESEGKQRIDFSIEDSGVGIEQDTIPTLFNSFTQADNSITRKYGGTGLGLSITKQLVELMGGKIDVTSQTQRGSRFFGHLLLGVSDMHMRDDKPLQHHVTVVVDSLLKRKEVISKQLQAWGAKVKDQGWDGLLSLCQHYESQGKPLVVFASLDKETQQTHLQLRELLATVSPELLKVVLVSGCNTDCEFLVNDYDNAICIGSPITSVLLAHSLDMDGPSHFETSDKVSAQGNFDFDSIAGSTLLIVDDNAINQAVVKGIFKDLPVELVVAMDGQQALDELNKRDDIDVILMDCQMPVLDGYSATTAIRSGEAMAHYVGVPIVAMTANAMAGDRERCLQAGMSDYVTKPIDAAHLIEKTYYWLSVARVKKSSILSQK